jgi:hypothetical protein
MVIVMETITANLSKFNLTESMAVVPVVCADCLDEIDIGDTCYVDHSLGTEEDKAIVYCEFCIEV